MIFLSHASDKCKKNYIFIHFFWCVSFSQQSVVKKRKCCFSTTNAVVENNSHLYRFLYTCFAERLSWTEAEYGGAGNLWSGFSWLVAVYLERQGCGRTQTWQDSLSFLAVQQYLAWNIPVHLHLDGTLVASPNKFLVALPYKTKSPSSMRLLGLYYTTLESCSIYYIFLFNACLARCWRFSML